MEFALDDTQQSVRDLATEVLSRERDREQPADAETASLWKAMAAAGLLSLAVPERLGGAGLGPMATGVLLTEVGRYAAQVPALATLALGVLPIARHGTEQQQDRLLGEADSGQILTAAVNEPSAPLPGAPKTSARWEKGSLVVSGTKTDVLHADVAREILVPVTVDDGGTAIAVVRPDAAGLSRETGPMSGARAATLRFEQVRAERLGEDPGAVADLYRCALAGMCALGDGAVGGALDLTTEHVRTRTQFGRPLATFQAVAGQTADIYVTARTLHLAALSACWRLAEGRDADDELAVAALWLAEEAPAAMHVAQHLHGGGGVDSTYPLHRHSSLVKDLARLVGGAGHRVDALADQLAMEC